MNITKTQLKQLEGSINVEDDITPISREPVQSVNANDWSEYSVSQLQDQRSILLQRLSAVQHSPQMFKAISQGIAQIDAILASKISTDNQII